MKKILIGAGAVVVILVGGALVAPSFIDWNAWKGDVTERASTALGRAVAIEGDLDFAILPTPRLTAEKIRVAGIEGGAEPQLLSLEAIEAEVALAPLLQGVVQVKGLTLVEPRLTLERLADGRTNWSFGAVGASEAPQGAAGETDADALRLDEVTIENGSVALRDPSGVTELRDINAVVSAQSLKGPFTADAEFAFDGRTYTIQANAGPIAADGAIPLGVALVVPDAGAKARFDGVVDAGGAQGRAKVEAADLARALGAFAPGADGNGALKRPLAAEAIVTAKGGAATLDELTLDFGGARATGKASFAAEETPRVELTLALGHLDLDPILAAAGEAPSQTDAPKAAQGGGFALPANVAASLDLSADTIVYRGKQVRQAQAALALQDGVLSLDRLSAKLPGPADVAASGTLKAKDGQPAFDVGIDAVAENLPATLGWLGVGGEGAGDKVRAAQFSGRVTGTPTNFQASDLEAVIDGQKLTGALSADLSGARPAFGVRLRAGKLDLDPYLPAPTEGGDAPSASSGGGDPLRAFDANVDLAAQSLKLRGETLAGVKLDATLANGALTIREASVESLAGAALKAQGKLGGIDPLKDVDLAVNVKTKEPKRLFDLLGVEPPVPAQRLRQIDLNGRVVGASLGDRLDVSLKGRIAGGQIDVGGAVGDAIDLKARVIFDQTSKLVALFAPDVAKDPALAGKFDLYAEIKGDAKAVTLDGIQGFVAGAPVKGRIAADLSGAKPNVDVTLQTGDLPLPLGGGAAKPSSGGAAKSSGAPWTDEKIDFSWLDAANAKAAIDSSALLLGQERLEAAKLRATLQDGALTLETLEGNLRGGAVKMGGLVKNSAAPTAQASLVAIGVGLPNVPKGGAVGLTDGRVDANLNLTTAGNTSRALVSALNGGGDLSLRDATLRGVNLKRLGRAMKNLKDPVGALALLSDAASKGKTKVIGLDAKIIVENGVARVPETRLALEGGEGTVSATADLPRWLLDAAARVGLNEDPSAPAFVVRLAGPLDAPRPQLDLNDLQAYASQKAADALLRNLVPGVAPQQPAGGGQRQAPAPAPLDPLLGGGSRPSGGGQQQQPSQQPQPEDVLRGLLGTALGG